MEPAWIVFFLKVSLQYMHLIIEVTVLFAECFMKIDISGVAPVGVGIGRVII